MLLTKENNSLSSSDWLIQEIPSLDNLFFLSLSVSTGLSSSFIFSASSGFTGSIFSSSSLFDTSKSSKFKLSSSSWSFLRLRIGLTSVSPDNPTIAFPVPLRFFLGGVVSLDSLDSGGVSRVWSESRSSSSLSLK